jgi:hypothetical protein
MARLIGLSLRVCRTILQNWQSEWYQYASQGCDLWLRPKLEISEWTGLLARLTTCLVRVLYQLLVLLRQIWRSHFRLK